MYISPHNIILGLIKILELNIDEINKVIKYYRETDDLHIFEGMRKTLPLSAYPCIEFEPASASTEWAHTSAQTGEYQIECYLTVRNSNEEYSAEYISEVARCIVKLFNYPGNMCFPIPNEYYPNEDASNSDSQSPGIPIWVQFGNVQNIQYRSTKDRSVQVATFTWSGRVLEYFDYTGDGPRKFDWKKDVLPH